MIDEVAVTRWLVGVLPQLAPPLEFSLIAGGNSNLTFVVRDAGGAELVLRRPPLGEVLPTAHDMAREHRILTALVDSAVPVPAPLALCRDTTVTGAPFYVMTKVAGDVIRDVEVARTRWNAAERYQVGLALVDTLVAVHEVVPARVGLGDLGRPTGYIGRQLTRWQGQLDATRVRPLPELEEVHRHLVARQPEQTSSGLVHGDFRLENCIVGPDATVRAVLDWELCTQGDPLADLGMLMVYWPSPDDPIIPFPDVPTLVPGFPRRAELLDRYASRRGIELPDIGFYTAFAYWRLACITEGVYARYLRGGLGDQSERAAQFGQGVLDLAAAASQSLHGIRS